MLTTVPLRQTLPPHPCRTPLDTLATPAQNNPRPLPAPTSPPPSRPQPRQQTAFSCFPRPTRSLLSGSWLRRLPLVHRPMAMGCQPPMASGEQSARTPTRDHQQRRVPRWRPSSQQRRVVLSERGRVPLQVPAPPAGASVGSPRASERRRKRRRTTCNRKHLPPTPAERKVVQTSRRSQRRKRRSEETSSSATDKVRMNSFIIIVKRVHL